MATDNPTATRSDESGPDSFDALDNRFMSLRSRLEVLKAILGDPENVPNELAPAAYVLNETIDEVVQFHDDLHAWGMNYKHTPKAVQS